MIVVTAEEETIELGDVEAAATIGITDYSRRETDSFGITTVVKRGYARHMSVRLALAYDDVDDLQRRLADLRATPAQWIADDRFAWLSVEGFYKDFQLDLAVPPLSYCTLTIEGLAEIAPAADPGGDPAPSGDASTLLLLNPVDVTSAMIVATNVPEADYPAWEAGTSYALGARVIKTATHRIYESAAIGNLGNDPAGESGLWIDVGPTNRWAMFDQALGTATTRADGISITLAPGAIDALALLDVVGTSVRVQAPGGYDQTIPVDAKSTTFLDLPGVVGNVIVTVSGAGDVAVGTLLVGKVAELGITEESPTAGITDFSRKEVDDFGEATVVQRAWAKRMSTRALIRTDAIDLVADRIAAVRARPVLWIGDSGKDSLTIYGFFKDFSIEVGETISKVSLSIEGLSQAAAIVTPQPRGNYATDATYVVGDTVVWAVADGGDGQGYVRTGIGSTTGVPPSDASKWTVYVARGGDGPAGDQGPTGINSAQVRLYKRSAAEPALPTALVTYTFATGAIAGVNNGWTVTVPNIDGNPLWTTVATAASNMATDTIPAGEWTAPTKHTGIIGSIDSIDIGGPLVIGILPTEKIPVLDLGGDRFGGKLPVGKAADGLLNTRLRLDLGTPGQIGIFYDAGGLPINVDQVGIDLSIIDPTAQARLDEAYDRAVTAADDGILSKDEKTQTLLPVSDDLAIHYSVSTARGTALGLASEVAAATAARDAWQAVLDAAVPDWDDATQDSVLAVPIPAGALTARDDFANAAWTKISIGYSLASGWWTLTDSSSGAFGLIEQTVTGLTVGAAMTALLQVKKDAVPKTTRYGAWTIATASGTAIVYFDTSTGEFINASAGTSGVVGVSVEDKGDYWLFAIDYVATQSSAFFRIYPAIGASPFLGSGASTARTGSIEVRTPAFIVGAFEPDGRAAYRSALEDYRAALADLDAAISAINDAARAAVEDGLEADGTVRKTVPSAKIPPLDLDTKIVDGSAYVRFPVETRDKVAVIEDEADVTRVLDIAPKVVRLRQKTDNSFYEGQIPFDIVPNFTKSGVNANATQSWDFDKSASITATQDTTSNGATEGKVTVTAVAGAGVVSISAAGLSQSCQIEIVKDAPPADSGTTSATISTYGSVSSSTYPSNPPVIKTTTANGSGLLKFVGSWQYSGADSVLNGKIVYRVAGSGGAWIDAQAENAGSPSIAGGYDPDFGYIPPTTGYWSASFTKSGLTASGSYEWGQMFRKTGGATTTPSGSTTGSQS